MNAKSCNLVLPDAFKIEQLHLRVPRNSTLRQPRTSVVGPPQPLGHLPFPQISSIQRSSRSKGYRCGDRGRYKGPESERNNFQHIQSIFFTNIYFNIKIM